MSLDWGSPVTAAIMIKEALSWWVGIGLAGAIIIVVFLLTKTKLYDVKGEGE